MSDSEPPSRAVALAYGQPGDAPRVLARGYGQVAESIIEKARQEGIYVHDSPGLVALLMRLDMDRKISPQLYQVIAELLVWVDGLRADSENEHV